MQLFKTWYEGLGIKYPTLGTLPPIRKENIFVSYSLEISKGRNIKNLPRLSVKPIHNKLRVAASHATYNCQGDTCLQYIPSRLTLDGAKPLPMLKKLLSHMSKLG